MAGKLKGKENRLVRNPYIDNELFTQRQWKILDLFMNNATEDEIAKKLRINVSTVRKFLYGSVYDSGSEEVGRTELGVSGILDSIKAPESSSLKIRLVAFELYIGASPRGGIVFPEIVRSLARRFKK